MFFFPFAFHALSFSLVVLFLDFPIALAFYIMKLICTSILVLFLNYLLLHLVLNYPFFYYICAQDGGWDGGQDGGQERGLGDEQDGTELQGDSGGAGTSARHLFTAFHRYLTMLKIKENILLALEVDKQ